MGLMNFKCLKPHQKLHQNHTKNPGTVPESRGQDLYFGTKVYGINEFQMPEKADWTKGPSLYGPYCSPMVYGIVAL